VHRVATDAIVVSFNTSIRGSVFDQLLFRPGNWNGEKGEQQLRVDVDKLRSKFESPLLSGLLLIRRNDKASNVATRRVVNCRLHKHTSVVQYLDSKKEWISVYSIGELPWAAFETLLHLPSIVSF